jgi:hypothetical protein
MTILDVARKLHVPGVSELVAFIEPTKLTNRTKLAAQRMIRAGALTGGYSSKTRKLADTLLDTYLKVPVPMRMGGQCTNLHTLPDEAKQKIRELADLAVTLAKMNDDTISKWYVSNAEDEASELLVALDGGRPRPHMDDGSAAIYYQNTIVRDAVMPQFNEVFDKCKTPEHLAALDVVARMLDQPHPIRIFAPV